MAVPLDQEIRPQRLTPDHPDGPSTPSTGPPAAPPEQAAAAAPIAPPPYPCGNCRAAPTRPGTADDRTTAPGRCLRVPRPAPAGNRRSCSPGGSPPAASACTPPAGATGTNWSSSILPLPVLPDPHRQRAGPLALRATRQPGQRGHPRRDHHPHPRRTARDQQQPRHRRLPGVPRSKARSGEPLLDRGLTVTLRISEDWDSFEATTSIDVTSPARPGSAPSTSPMTATWTGTATGAPPSTATPPRLLA